MLGEIATMTGYVKAPKTTFVVRHPVKSLRMARVRREMEDAITRERIALGMGALAALSLTVWLGERWLVWRRDR
jgi:hypothetical protein